MKPKASILFLLLVNSSHAYASDPTPLFVMFVAIPLIFFAVLVLLLCMFVPKKGRVASVILFLAHFLVVAWASDVGYMDSAGEWVGVSLLLNFIGIILATLRLNKLSAIQEQEEP